MKLTSTGKWLLNAFLNKDVDEQDQPLAAVVDVLQAIAQPEEFGDPDDTDSMEKAYQLGLIEEGCE